LNSFKNSHGNKAKFNPRNNNAMIIKKRKTPARTNPIMAMFLPALILLNEAGVYAPGLELYNAMSLLASTKATMAKTRPTMPWHQQRTTETIPKVNTVDALGNGTCWVIGGVDFISAFSMDRWFKGLKVIYF
jgi:hypothetical protein